MFILDIKDIIKLLLLLNTKPGPELIMSSCYGCYETVHWLRSLITDGPTFPRLGFGKWTWTDQKLNLMSRLDAAT